LTSQRIRKNSQEIETTLSRGKEGKKPSGEQQRRIPLQDGQMTFSIKRFKIFFVFMKLLWSF